MPTISKLTPGLFLGIDGGGTRTTALLADSAGRALGRLEAGPANLKLLTDAQLTRHFRSIAAAFPQPTATGIGLAGAWAEPDRQRIRLAAAKVWPRVPCYATHDLETTLAAAAETSRGPALTQVLVLSGTGSCCYGANAAGLTAKVGGWGHVLGDQASGYEIGLRALRTVACRYDETASWPKLGARLLGTLGLNEPNDLIDWAQAATTADVAALAFEVFEAWQAGDKLASWILTTAAGARRRRREMRPQTHGAWHARPFRAGGQRLAQATGFPRSGRSPIAAALAYGRGRTAAPGGRLGGDRIGPDPRPNRVRSAECGVRSAEWGRARPSAECGVRSAEWERASRLALRGTPSRQNPRSRAPQGRQPKIAIRARWSWISCPWPKPLR